MQTAMKGNYAGLDNDDYGGMTPVGNMIRDAWLFGILPETEKCENWSQGQLQVIFEQVRNEWDKYGCLVSNLPEDLKQKYATYSNAAIKKARELGWDPEVLVNEENESD
jgi:hypothetical protein